MLDIRQLPWKCTSIDPDYLRGKMAVLSKESGVFAESDVLLWTGEELNRFNLDT